MKNTSSEMRSFLDRSLSITLPKPKLKRSFNLACSIVLKDNPSPPPFEIKTKTIEDCARLIIKQKKAHELRSSRKIYNINL